jgi:alpha-amylase
MNPHAGRAPRQSLLAALLLLAAAAPPLAAQAASAATWAAGDEVVYQIFVRSFRDSDGDRVGDLRGIQEELGYLQQLGVTSLLLTPINPSPTYHNYFASRFDGVDSSFGDEAAFHALVEAVHRRGMKIYLDEEIQYAVRGNPWLDESLGHPESRYSHYIVYTDAADTATAPIIYGLTALPTWTGEKIPVATVNMREPGVLHYFEGLFASLVDPNHDGRFDDGVDGFRLDHMEDDLDGSAVNKNLFADFWAPIFARVRGINPRVRIIAEQADWGDGEDWLTRGGADLVFAFPLERAIAAFNRDSIAAAIAQTLARTPAGKGQLVFIENHDMSRFASRVHGDLRREKVGAALNVLLKGTPLIYYGQEIGMRGEQSHAWNSDANDIPDREAMRWTPRLEDPGSAIWYRDTGPWWTQRFNRDGDGISVAEERDDPGSLLSFYRRLLAVRRSRPELVAGDERVIGAGAPGVLAVLRSTPAQAGLLLVNLSDSEATAVVARDSLPAALAGGAVADVIAGGRETAAGGELRVALAPFGVKLLARSR